MTTKNTTNSNLLDNLRKAAESGIILIQDSILQSSGDIVSMGNAKISIKELDELDKLLEKIKGAKTIEEMKKLLTLDCLPTELVIINQFWGDFQRLIYKLIL